MKKLTVLVFAAILGFTLGFTIALWSAPIVKEGQEPVSLQEFKQDKIVFASRAPNSGDRGMLWIQYVEGNDTTITMYLRHPRTGTWRSEAFN